MRILIAQSRTYNGRSVIPIAVPPVVPVWAGLHWTRESWPAGADIYFALEYFEVSDKKWHPIVSIRPTPGDVWNKDRVTKQPVSLRTEDSIRSAHRITDDKQGPWFHLGRPMPSQMHVVVETNMPITTALSLDWN